MDQLTTLLQKVDNPLGQYARLDRYYDGRSPLSFLAPEAAALLGDRLRRLSVNVPKLLVDSIAQRLRVTGFGGVDIWDDWLRSDLDQMAPVLHKETLVLGAAYALVWAGPDGRPQVSVESAHQMASLIDPATREVTAALKRWETDRTTECSLFLPDRVERYRANSTGATTAGFKLIDTYDNPMGVPPVVRFTNADRLLDIDGRSEIEDIVDLSDALTKLLVDLMVTSESVARPRRYGTGIELAEDEEGNAVSPFDETTMMLLTEEKEAKFGQLPGADLNGYRTAIDTIMRMISAVSGLPEHALGIGGEANPTSADAIRASEAALTAKAEAKSKILGRSWEQVARLIVGVRDGADPASVEPRVEWADPATRSEAQQADAVVKLYQSGLLPASFALRKLGYSDSEIAEIHAARARDNIANADVSQLFGGAA